MSFISYLVNGLSLGSVYALIALGYTMVYGIAKMLNFAHGDVIMIGAYVALVSMNQAGMSGSGCSSDLDCCVYSPGSCDGADCL